MASGQNQPSAAENQANSGPLTIEQLREEIATLKAQYESRIKELEVRVEELQKGSSLCRGNEGSGPNFAVMVSGIGKVPKLGSDCALELTWFLSRFIIGAEDPAVYCLLLSLEPTPRWRLTGAVRLCLSERQPIRNRPARTPLFRVYEKDPATIVREVVLCGYSMFF